MGNKEARNLVPKDPGNEVEKHSTQFPSPILFRCRRNPVTQCAYVEPTAKKTKNKKKTNISSYGAGADDLSPEACSMFRNNLCQNLRYFSYTKPIAEAELATRFRIIFGLLKFSNYKLFHLTISFLLKNGFPKKIFFKKKGRF